MDKGVSADLDTIGNTKESALHVNKVLAGFPSLEQRTEMPVKCCKTSWKV